MDPLTKSLVETVNRIVTEANGKDDYSIIDYLNPSRNQDDGWKPKPPKRGVTKDGKIITINDPGYRPRKGREHIIDGSGRSNRWMDQQGNIHVTYGVTDTPPPGMKRVDFNYTELGDDYKEGDNLQDYYNKKTSEQYNTTITGLLGNKPEPKPKPKPTPGKTPYDDRAGRSTTPEPVPTPEKKEYKPPYTPPEEYPKYMSPFTNLINPKFIPPNRPKIY